MPTVLVILAIKTLITLSRVSSHLIWPLEIWFILYLVKNLVYGLPKNCINYLSNRMTSVSQKISLGSIVIISLQPEISSIKGVTFAFPIPRC